MGRVHQSIEVGAPVEACYAVLQDWERYPRFVKGLESIRQKGDPQVWQWTVKGPKGEHWVWDAELDGRQHQHNIISWHTVRNADIPHSGAIILNDLGQGRTRISMTVEYATPPSIPGDDWESGMKNFWEDCVSGTLQAFKSMMEQAQVAAQQKR